MLLEFASAWKMTQILRRWLLLLAVGSLSLVARGDGLDNVEQVRLRSADSMPSADRIVVRKGERKLMLMRGDDILRSYRVALGLNPVGHKERAGDFRTPEGRYRLTRRNPRSDYFLSIQVSYPNDSDLKRARRNGWDVGGSIMIHGMPNVPRHQPMYYESRDWTDGCIAVTNADMLEIWLLAVDNAPIEILP
jgi:murein L,D-transpeptidase YafK